MNGIERLGGIVKRAREDAGEGIREFARNCITRSGVEMSYSTISKIERNEGIDIESVVALASHPFIKKNGYTALDLVCIYANLEKENNDLSVADLQDTLSAKTDTEKYEIVSFVVEGLAPKFNKKLISVIIEVLSPTL